MNVWVVTEYEHDGDDLQLTDQTIVGVYASEEIADKAIDWRRRRRHSVWGKEKFTVQTTFTPPDGIT